ncbi:Peptidase inhibitor I9, partial [Geosmithia morbida]
MPAYIVSCNESAKPEEVADAKQHCRDQGGTIKHEYTIIKGFSVEFPEDAVTTLENHPHIKSVENDGVMKIQ